MIYIKYNINIYIYIYNMYTVTHIIYICNNLDNISVSIFMLK